MAETDTTAAGGTGEKAPIPYDRFQAVVADRNDLKGKLEEMGRQVQSLTEKAATADTLAAQFREAQAALAKERESWGMERAIIGAGISDPEGVDFTRLAYERVKPDAAGKKPSITDWLGQRDALPKAIQAYMPSGDGAQQGTQQGAQGAQGTQQGAQQGQQAQSNANPGQQGKPPPNANAGTKPFTAAPGTFTPEGIASLTPEQFKANRDAILKQIGRGR